MSSMHRRGERGAIAVLSGVLAVVVLITAALAVDLSNGFVRGRDVQAQADFGALGGADLLPGSKVASDPAIQKVVEYLNEPGNQPKDDKGITPVTADALVDGPLVDPDKAITQEFERNGEVYFESAGRMRVIAPEARVDFGLAGIAGFTETDVNGEATVGIFSPGTGPMPVYAAQGCDYGPQTFLDPAGGQTVPVERPPMLYDTTPPAFNNARLDTLTTNPTPVTVGQSGVQLTIDGAQINAAATGVVKIGFFRDRTDPTAVPNFVDVVPTTRTANMLVGIIPDAVTAVEAVWWVRVFKGATASDGSWSDPALALPLRVGQAVLQCESGSSDGNFGTLYLPRTDVTSQDDMIAKNMTSSLEFDLAVMPTTGPSPLCTGAGLPAVHAPEDGTNCVDTKTGLPANATTQGLITGIDGEPGRLDQDTTDRCQESVHGLRPGRAESGIPGFTVNDDILTCFFTNDTATVDAISRETYPYTEPVLDSSIYSSPRFTWVPVLFQEPTWGGSQKYSIKEFRPAFITDQPTTANHVNHSMGTTTQNGLVVEQPAGNRVSRVSVVFFNPLALPNEVADGGPVSNWMGFGPKVVRLVD